MTPDIPEHWKPIGPVPSACECPPGWWPGIRVALICQRFAAQGKTGDKARQCRHCGHHTRCHKSTRTPN